MTMYKTIVCLANSTKRNLRCVAGKEVNNGQIGGWIRPVSNRPNGGLEVEDMLCQDRQTPNLLDIVTIPLAKHKPDAYQTENHLIDQHDYWQRAGAMRRVDLAHLCDAPETLWINSYSSFSGLNDRIPVPITEERVRSSLYLINPSSLALIVAQERDGKKVRAEFIYRQQRYRLSITDPAIETRYLLKPEGTYPVDSASTYLCISLGERYNGYCYKIVAAIISAA